MEKRSRKPSLSDLVVLSLLAETPMHGYQIVSELDRRDAKDWAPFSRPQVYYSINKLAQMRLIEAIESGVASLGPEKVHYRITKKGQVTLEDELSKEEWAMHRSPPPFLTWMALSSHLSKRATLKVVRARKEFLSGELDRERITLKEVESDSGAMNAAARLMISLTNQLFETELRWLKQVEKTLGSARK